MTSVVFSSVSKSVKDIVIKDITLTVQGKILLQNTSLKIVHGHRYALVGQNGCGKSTILRLLVSGELPVPQKTNLFLVKQELEETDETCFDYVLRADTNAIHLIEEQSIIEDRLAENMEYEEMQELLERLNEIEIALNNRSNSKAQVSKILNGLGFTETMKDDKMKTLSGGWRMRLSLAQALFMKPDILLLDEPTNHLDVHAIIWLESYLQSWEKTIIVVTHDRYFINEIATDTIYMHNLKLRSCRGDYDDLQNTLAQEKQKDPKTLSSYFKFIECPYEIPNCAAINVHNVEFGYSNKTIIHNLDVCIDNSSRIVLIGPNGSGKTTILKLIVGILEPQRGEINIHKKLKIGYYGQHTVDMLTQKVTALQYLDTSFPNVGLTELNKTLNLFGLSYVDRKKPLNTLSGGQKSRVIFAYLYLLQPHLLILDEPSNHLDMLTIDALAKSLNDFKGGIILSSHNSQLLSQVANDYEKSRIWIVNNGYIETYDGSFDSYRDDIISKLEDTESI